jgi:NTP pyrophosphatase (non-canonical NTP hydrolase)
MNSKEYIKILRDCYAVDDLKINALGICAEAGEFANLIKKAYFGKEPKREDLLDELGDVCWHLAQAADNLGVDLETLFALSARKTMLRNRKGGNQQ